MAKIKVKTKPKLKKYVKGGEVVEKKKIEDSFVDANNFLKNWQQSPMYNEMLNNSSTGEEYSKISNYRNKSLNLNPVDNLNVEKTLLHNPNTTGFVRKGIPVVNISSDWHNNNEMLSNLKTESDSLKVRLGETPDYKIPTNFVTPSTIVHEMSHITDWKGLPKTDLQKIKNFSSDRDKNKFSNYVANPSETRSRLNEIRYENSLLKYYNPLTEKINKDQYNNYLKDKSRGNALNDLKNVYSDDEIIDMLNSISENKSPQEQIPMAKNGGNITTENNMKTKIKKGKKLPKAKLGKGVDPFMQNAIANKINYWNEKNANGDLPQQINLGNVGGKYTVPPAQDYGDIDESQFGQQNPNYLENPLLTQEIVKEPDYKNSLKLKNQIEDYRNPTSKVNFKKPSLSMFPTVGNKYLNRGMQYLNQSIAHANAIGTDPNSWEQPLNYQNGISNNPFLTTDVSKKYTTLRPKQDTYTLPTEDVQLPETQQSLTPKLTKFANGGRQPIIVNDKNDPRLQAYQDSLDLYNMGQISKNNLKNLGQKYSQPQLNTEWDKWLNSPNGIKNNQLGVNAALRLNKYNNRFPQNNGGLRIGNSIANTFTKPVQPVVLTPNTTSSLPTTTPTSTLTSIPTIIKNRPKEPKFELNQEQQYLPQKEQHLEFDPIGLKKGTYFTRPRQQQEEGSGHVVDYFDSKTGKLIKTMGDGGMNQNQFNNLQALGTGVNATQSGINFGKGITDIMGTQLQNNQVQNMENQLYTQSVFSGAIDTRPQEQYGYSWQGRNSLAENGMQIKEIGGQGIPSVEVEGDEHIKLPNGFSQEIKGKSHSEGGIPLNLPTDSKVFSEKLKIETPKGKKSYSDLAKPFETKKNFEMMKAKHGDDIQKRTAEMIIKFKNNKLEQLFEQQEQDKIQGLHGKQVQKETMEEYSPIAENGIHIKPENKGKFNATKKRTGKSTEELTHSKNPITKKRAIFAQNASHWSKKETGGNVIKDNLVNYNGDLYNQDIIDGLDRDNRVNTNHWNNNLNRSGVTTDEEFYKKFPTQEEFMFKYGKYYGKNLGVNRYVGNEKQMSFGGNIMTEKFSNLPMAENGVEIPIKNKSYSPIEAEEVISDYKLNPTYRYINDAKNIAEGKKRLKEQLQFNKSLTPELSKKIDSAKTFNDLNPIAGILQEGTYNLHPQAAEHYGLNIAPTRKGLEYLAKKFPNKVKDVKIGVHGQPDISPDKYQALISKLSEKDKKDYAKTNYQDSEWFYRNPEFKSFKFKNKEDYDKYVQDNKQNQYGDYFFSGTEGLYLKPEYPQDSLNKQTPRGKNPTTERIVEKIVDRQPEYNINPNMDIQFPLPNVYGRTPLNYYQTDPNYINPRYLDVQPQLNEVSRGQRAFQNNLGSRGNTEMGNLLQSQANAYNQQNQIFGNKFEYDRNQDSQTQQFNANAKTQNDTYNQGTWYNQLEDPIRRRESNIGVQQLTDQYRGQERADQALAFKNTKEFMDKYYSYFTNLSPEAQVAYMEVLSKQKQPTKKYGGKVKIKPTLKKKK